MATRARAPSSVLRPYLSDPVPPGLTRPPPRRDAPLPLGAAAAVPAPSAPTPRSQARALTWSYSGLHAERPELRASAGVCDPEARRGPSRTWKAGWGSGGEKRRGHGPDCYRGAIAIGSRGSPAPPPGRARGLPGFRAASWAEGLPREPGPSDRPYGLLSLSKHPPLPPVFILRVGKLRPEGLTPGPGSVGGTRSRARFCPRGVARGLSTRGAPPGAPLALEGRSWRRPDVAAETRRRRSASPGPAARASDVRPRAPSDGGL